MAPATVGLILMIAGAGAGIFALIPFLALLLRIYFYPTEVARRRGHPNAEAIGTANLLFGWTFIGWGICLVWAMMRDSRTTAQS